MKKLFTAVGVLAVILSAATGCDKNQQTIYEIYTNIPSDYYEIDLDYFKTADTIPGGTYTEVSGGGASDTTSYRTVGKTFYDIMTADATIVVSTDFGNAEEAEARCNAFVGSVREKLEEINTSLSIGVENSAVSLFNSSNAGTVIQIDKTAYEVFGLAKTMYGFTDGYYNPAVYYCVEAYGFNTNGAIPETAKDLPAAADIEKYKQLASHFGEVQAYEQDGEYFVRKPDATVEIGGVTYSMKIDLGGIGKGYAADIVNSMMEESGFEYGYFDFGSSSIVCKNHFKNGYYELGFKNPRAEYFGQFFMRTRVGNECLSTSADDVKYYVIDGVRYCHVIDPTTGKPVQTGIMSATVIGGTAAEGDALTTALMAMGKDKAIEFISSKLTDRRVAFTYDKKLHTES